MNIELPFFWMDVIEVVYEIDPNGNKYKVVCLNDNYILSLRPPS